MHRILNLKKYCKKKLSSFLENDDLELHRTSQTLWEGIKKVTKQCIKSFGIKHISWRRSALKQLERKRNNFLRSKPPIATRIMILARIDNMIETLQQELVEIAALKSGVTWREKGKKSAKYLKSIHQHRTAQQYMPGLRDPTISTSTTPELPAVSQDSATMQTIAQRFYQRLYSTDDVDDKSIGAYLNEVTPTSTLTEEDSDLLTAPITLQELQNHASRLSSQSSPGSDGLGYPYLALLFSIQKLGQLVLTVYSDALDSIFPESWQDIRVRLLPKKGDLSLLKNWCPISLINCDAKIFTRILAKRLGGVINNILNVYQTGFILGRFIGDNGFAMSMILDQSRGLDHPGVGILLDQEKAYDRVHPQYLKRVLEYFDFPTSFIQCISTLFFDNSVYININGFFTETITQQRGLRQVDPLSPLLFNLAMEPFLLHILQEDGFNGYNSTDGPSETISTTTTAATTNTTIKCLAYADDVCVLLDQPEEPGLLLYHMQRYADVSNAKFNEDKSEAFLLNGKLDIEWKGLLESHNIRKFYHDGASDILRYLGFRFPFGSTQRQILESQLICSVRTQCQLYSQRQLSIQGRSTVCNILILSKIWYCLRLLQPTKKFFQQLKSLISIYLAKENPKIEEGAIIYADRIWRS